MTLDAAYMLRTRIVVAQVFAFAYVIYSFVM